MEQLTSRNPRTGELVADVPVTPPDQVGSVIDRSRKAFEEWGALSHAERKPHLKALKRAVLDNDERIARVVRAETGKDLSEALASEVVVTLGIMDFYIRNAARLLERRKGSRWPFVTTDGWTEYHPRGVAGIITPYNFPFQLAMGPVFTALAAGCTVVLKPSEITPMVGEVIKELADLAGLPTDVVQVIHGHGETGAALAGGDVDVISFTGSPETGRRVLAAAAERLTPVILELGGKDAIIVLEDADLRQAARGTVFAGLLNAGQVCVSAERVYVIDEIYEDFLQEVHREFDTLSIGTGEAGDIGAIIDHDQIPIIKAHIADARAKGARVLRGGNTLQIGSGTFVEPTLMVDVDHSMDIMREETFGPVLAIMRVPDEQAALELANDTRYGLHGAVWTRDRERGARVASQMRTGSVAINDPLMNFAFPSVPFGGVGESGFGSAFGPEGIRAFCYPMGITSGRYGSTLRLLGAWLPRRRSVRFWRWLGRTLYRW